MKNWLRSSVAGIAALCLALAPAAAQNTFSTTGTPQGPKVGGEVVMCINASSYAVPCSSGTPLPISGTITASLGGFTPSTSGARMTQLPVTTADSSGNLPTGAVAVIGNTGTTNPMYCNVNGVAATTSDQPIPISSWFAFTIPSGVTTLHCIATGGSTTANGVGGAGLATGAGGGGGGGSSSNASVGATASGVPGSATYIGVNVGGNLTGLVGTANGLKVDGSAVTQPVSGAVTANAGTGTFTIAGAVTNAGTFATQLTGSTNNINNIAGTVSLPTGASTAALQTTANTSLATIATNTGAAVPAGGNLIGNFGQIYPAGSTPITASATGTTAATTATLAASASLHTWICGLSIRANATAAATGNATVTGPVTGTMNFTQWTAPNASGLGVTEEGFTPCVESSATNTGISVISAAPGTGGVVSVSAWGFQL
jgi:hypothetical protein